MISSSAKLNVIILQRTVTHSLVCLYFQFYRSLIVFWYIHKQFCSCFLCFRLPRWLDVVSFFQLEQKQRIFKPPWSQFSKGFWDIDKRFSWPILPIFQLSNHFVSFSYPIYAHLKHMLGFHAIHTTFSLEFVFNSST